MARDFDSILAAILGRTQLLLRAAPDTGQHRQLDVIERAALDGAQVVRRVQEFTRLRQDERFDSLDVQEMLQGVPELTRPSSEPESKRRGIALATVLDLHAGRLVAGNASETPSSPPNRSMAPAQIEGRDLQLRDVGHVISKLFSLEDVRDVLRWLSARPARAA